MKDARNEVKTIVQTIEYGMFLSTITALIDFCVLHKKKNIIEKIKETSKEFQSSLTENEATEYRHFVDDIFKAKSDELIKELQSSLRPDEVEQLLSKLKQESFSAS